MRVIFLSHTYIGSPFVVGSHHLSRELRNMGHEVVHVSHPVSLLHLLMGRAKRKKTDGMKEGGILQFSPMLLFPLKMCLRILGYRITGYMCRISRIFSWHETLNDKFDLCLIDDPSMFIYRDFIQSDCWIYRPTDNYFLMEYGALLSKCEDVLLKKVDGVVATNEKVCMKTYTPRIVVPNGFDEKHFITQSEPQSYTADFTYVGAIDYRFSIEDLVNAAEVMKDKTFYIYSPDEININLPNVFRMGAADYNAVPEILRLSKVLMMPFNCHESNLGRSPMKLFEYAGTGRPIVMPAYIDSFGLDGVYRYSDATNFVNSLSKALSGERDFNRKIPDSMTWRYKSKEIVDFYHDIKSRS